MGRRFFPLDEALGLLPGQLTPQLQEKLVRLGSWLPFGPTAQLFTAFTGVGVSESTARRITQAAGATQVAHQERMVETMEAGEVSVPEQAPEKLAFAVDGAMVPLVRGEWQEVRTLVIGEVSIRHNHRGERVICTDNLSYFSRLMDAQMFQRASLAETERRGLYHARQAALVGDGAEWVQGYGDYHRPDAVRILDFPHASERFTTIQEKCIQAGVDLGETWAQEQRQQLKERGGSHVLTSLQALQEQQPQVELAEPLAYLTKREAMMRYPQFHADGWPIGSGMVESANKLVVEARLKGAGMHWHRENVNPMLALRNVVCNNQWEAAWPTMAQRLRRRQPVVAPGQPQKPRSPEANHTLVFYRQQQRLERERQAQQPAAESTQPRPRPKPAADHPWRKSYKR